MNPRTMKLFTRWLLGFSMGANVSPEWLFASVWRVVIVVLIGGIITTLLTEWAYYPRNNN